MPFQAVPGVYGVVIRYLDDGQEVLNDIYFSRGGSANLPEMISLADNVRGMIIESLLPALAETLIYQGQVVTDLEIQDGLQFSDSLFTGTTGGIASEQTPNSVAACLSIRTGFRGRSSRGRNYVGGVPNVEVATNTISPAFQSAVINAYQSLLPLGTHDPGGLLRWVVVSRNTLGGPRPTGIFLNVESAIFTVPFVRSQRRRLPNVGA